MQAAEYLKLCHNWLTQYIPPISFSDKLRNFYLFLVVTAAVLVQFMTPIKMGDTDMWYHLSDGKYFWENLRIADHYFYSFYPKVNEWYNHFWGFQAVIYKFYEYGID